MRAQRPGAPGLPVARDLEPDLPELEVALHERDLCAARRPSPSCAAPPTAAAAPIASDRDHGKVRLWRLRQAIRLDIRPSEATPPCLHGACARPRRARAGRRSRCGAARSARSPVPRDRRPLRMAQDCGRRRSLRRRVPRSSSSASGKRARSISSIDGKYRLSQNSPKCAGSNVTTTSRPSAPSTRRSSRNATGRSTRWQTSHRTARSNQPSRNGRSSARPGFNPTEAGTLPAATRSISGSGSTPQTFEAADSASAWLRRPVPQPQSSTRRPRRSPSRTTSS